MSGFVEFLAARQAEQAAWDRLLAIAPALGCRGWNLCLWNEINAEVQAARADHIVGRLACPGTDAPHCCDTNVVVADCSGAARYSLLTQVGQRLGIQLFSSQALLDELAGCVTLAITHRWLHPST